MRLIHGTALLAALLLAPAASAQLAVAPTFVATDAVQRHLVSAVVEPALEHWQGIAPQLLDEDLRTCPANDVSCLRKLARKRGAAHVLVVSVAPLGPRDAVVAVQLYSVQSDTPLFEDTAVQPGDAGGDDDGRGQARELTARLLKVEGLMSAGPAPVAPTVPEPTASELGPLGFGGIGAIAVGAVGAAATTIVAANQFGNDQDYDGALATTLWGGGVSGALVIAGIVLVTVDTL